MVGLDTNVLVRLATNDDPRQAARARALIRAEGPAFVNRATMLEFVWVLQYVYEYAREDIVGAMERLLNVDRVIVEDRLLIERAAALFGRGADFADALFAESNVEQGCTTTYTFDKPAAKRLAHMTLV